MSDTPDFLVTNQRDILARMSRGCREETASVKFRLIKTGISRSWYCVIRWSSYTVRPRPVGGSNVRRLIKPQTYLDGTHAHTLSLSLFPFPSIFPSVSIKFFWRTDGRTVGRKWTDVVQTAACPTNDTCGRSARPSGERQSAVDAPTNMSGRHLCARDDAGVNGQSSWADTDQS